MNNNNKLKYLKKDSVSYSVDENDVSMVDSEL